MENSLNSHINPIANTARNDLKAIIMKLLKEKSYTELRWHLALTHPKVQKAREDERIYGKYEPLTDEDGINAVKYAERYVERLKKVKIVI
jgi:hypothetical protein